MKVDEIYTIPSYDYQGENNWGDVLLPVDLKSMGKPIPLPDGLEARVRSDYVSIYKPIKEDGEDVFLRIAGMELLGSDLPTPKPARQVDTLSVHPKYRKKGLARILYHLALRYVSPYLEAGYQQTPGGKKMWLALANDPQVQVQGLVEFLEQEVIDQKYQADWAKKAKAELLKKFMALGPEYMGKSRDSKNKLIFLVPIVNLGRALALAQEFSDIQLYHEVHRPPALTTGLLATWRG
jgi:GNAT superfamily N-acetyltransferase